MTIAKRGLRCILKKGRSLGLSAIVCIRTNSVNTLLCITVDESYKQSPLKSLKCFKCPNANVSKIPRLF